MKYILAILLCVGLNTQAADSSFNNNDIPAFINIPYYANLQALAAQAPTQVVRIPITPATTPLEIQQALRDRIGLGILMYGIPPFPQKIDDLAERFHSIRNILANEDNDLDDFEELEENLFFVPLKSGHKIQKPLAAPDPRNKKSTPQI